MNNVEKLKRIIEENGGILLANDLRKYDIHKQYLKQLEEKGDIKRVARGIYLLNDKEVNDFFLIGEKYKKGIFSHNTALYFYNLTDRTPLQLDLTFPSNITVHDDSIKIHYIKEENHLLGATEMKLKDETTIRIYNLERTICDIIKSRNKLDPQILNTAMQEYVRRKDNDYNLLVQYAKKFRIENILKKYMEVL